MTLAEEERERWTNALKALRVEVHPGLSIIENLGQLIELGRVQERERCAKVAEDLGAREYECNCALVIASKIMKDT